jgi:hypothetical protein
VDDEKKPKRSNQRANRHDDVPTIPINRSTDIRGDQSGDQKPHRETTHREGDRPAAISRDQRDDQHRCVKDRTFVLASALEFDVRRVFGLELTTNSLPVEHDHENLFLGSRFMGLASHHQSSQRRRSSLVCQSLYSDLDFIPMIRRQSHAHRATTAAANMRR